MTPEQFKETGLYKIAMSGNKATREGVAAGKAMTHEQRREQFMRNSEPYLRSVRLASSNASE